jgi:MoaA/NifB/PqqE/SkfB family radical SAM enzyme
LSAKLLLEQGSVEEAFKAINRALEYDAYCEMAISVLLSVLRVLPRPDQWSGFFGRSASPSIADLQRSETPIDLLYYLSDFWRAVRACDDLESDANSDTVHAFYHGWSRVYRPEDSRIGSFRAHDGSDHFQQIAALRHIIEFATSRRYCGGSDREEGADWAREAHKLCLALESRFCEIPVLILSADYLADSGCLAQRASNIHSQCLITQYVLDCIEHALQQRFKGLPGKVSMKSEPLRRFLGKFCNVPFDQAYISPTGDTFLCCSGLVPVSIGNIFKEKNWNEVWNSQNAQEIRSSILDGTYKYCNKRACRLILNDGLIRNENLSGLSDANKARWEKMIFDQSVQIRDTLFADLGYDASCNLRCPQCRLDLIVLDREGFDALDAVRAGMIDDLLSRLRVVRVTSGGEALFSRHFRKVLRDINPTTCPELTHLELLTNGMLFNQRQWETFANLHYLKILVCFSIDAASKDTFEAIRRNGRWERMVDNLEFASRLRSERKIDKFLISYAVQEENFREMPALVRMAEEFHVDQVAFFRLENAGTYAEEDFRARNVIDPSHPLHQEFLTVIRDPALASPLVVDHNLGPYITGAHGPRTGRPALALDPFFGERYS